MKKLEVTMGCSACKWKITEGLKDVGINNFDIDMNTNIISFPDDINIDLAIAIIRKLNYYCELLDEEGDNHER